MNTLDVNLATGLEYGLYPFVVTDTLKVLAAAGLLPLAWKLVNRDKKA
jgi:biotin transport system substrate-specific component